MGNAVSGIGFQFGVLAQLTTVQVNAIVLIYCHPFFGIAFTVMILKEPFERRTLVALGFALPFVLLLIVPSFLTSPAHLHVEQSPTGTHRDSLVGDVFGLLSASCTAGYVVLCRFGTIKRPGTLPSVLAGYALGQFLAGIVSLSFASIDGTVLTGLDWVSGPALVGNVLVIAGWCRLTATASAHLTVPEVTLISLLDILLSPALVALFFEEYPSTLQLVAGLSVFFILLLHEVFAAAQCTIIGVTLSSESL